MINKCDWYEIKRLLVVMNEEAKKEDLGELEVLKRLSDNVQNQVYKLMALRDNEFLHTMKDYCSQNNGECSSCSLVSYGRDCMNNLISK